MVKEKKVKGTPKFAFDIRRYIDKNPEIFEKIDEDPEMFVRKYEKYLNMHEEDDELTRCYPDEFERSVRVLPMEIEGEKCLLMKSTDIKKTEDLQRFLKKGKFIFEPEFIDGVDREEVIEVIRKRIRERED